VRAVGFVARRWEAAVGCAGRRCRPRCGLRLLAALSRMPGEAGCALDLRGSPPCGGGKHVARLTERGGAQSIPRRCLRRPRPDGSSAPVPSDEARRRGLRVPGVPGSRLSRPFFSHRVGGGSFGSRARGWRCGSSSCYHVATLLARSRTYRRARGSTSLLREVHEQPRPRCSALPRGTPVLPVPRTTLPGASTAA